MSEMPVNFDKLNEMKSIMGEVFNQLIPAYIEQSDEMIADMPERLSNGELDILERHAHSMKSSSLNIGADHLSDIAKALEDMSHHKESSALLDEKIKLITAEYARVKDALQNNI